MSVSEIMTPLRFLAAVGLLVTMAVPAFGQRVAYVGATVDTMGPEGRIENAIIVVDGSEIMSIGVDNKIPDGARRVSLAGKVVVPGIIDPYYVLGRRQTAQPAGGGFRGRGGRGGGGGVTQGPFRRLVDTFYPHDIDFKPTLRSGITTANLVLVGHGQSAVARIHPKLGAEMIFDAAGLMYAAVTNETSALDTIRNGLDPERAARAGATGGGGRGARGGRRGGRAGRGGGGGGGSGAVTDPNQAIAKALWKSVLAGEERLFLNANNAASVLHVIKLLRPHDKVKLALVGSGPNLYQVLDDVKTSDVTLILQPSIDQVPYTTDRMCVATMAHDMKVPFVFSMSLSQSQLAASQDDPLFSLAALIKVGLPPEVALRAVTLGPAEVLGIADTHGSLEQGKKANFLVFDGDPLTTGSRLEQVVVEGNVVHEG